MAWLPDISGRAYSAAADRATSDFMNASWMEFVWARPWCDTRRQWQRLLVQADGTNINSCCANHEREERHAVLQDG